MAKYLLNYHGGGMAEGEEAQAKVMEAWGAWFRDTRTGTRRRWQSCLAGQDDCGRRISFGRRWLKPIDRLQPDRGRQPGRGGRAGEGLPGARERRQHRGRGQPSTRCSQRRTSTRSGFLQAGNARVRAATARVAGRPRHAADSPTRDNSRTMSEEEVPAGPPAWPGGATYSNDPWSGGDWTPAPPMSGWGRSSTTRTNRRHHQDAPRGWLCSGSSSSSLSLSQARPRPRSSQPGGSVARAARRASRPRAVDINTSLGSGSAAGGDGHGAHILRCHPHQRPRRCPGDPAVQRAADLDRRQLSRDPDWRGRPARRCRPSSSRA